MPVNSQMIDIAGSLRSCCAAFLLLLLGACEPPARQMTEQADSSVVFHACERHSRTLMPALVAEARCTILSVPENPFAPDARQLELKVMLIPAIRALPERDPLVILAGGPGEAATETATALLPAFTRIRQQRDIVLFDQRGTGSLSPFNCNPDAEIPADLSSMDTLLAEQHERLTRCLNELQEQGIAAEYYTTDIAVQDIERVRQLLGYEELNLWGGSYGSRVALAYLETFPERSRSIIIDGVAPPDIMFTTVQRDASAALETVLGLCAGDSACNARFPDLRGQLTAVLERLASPASVNINHARTGVPEDSFELGADVVRVLLTQILYSREYTRLLPFIIEALYRENYQVLAVLLSSSQDAINQGMHFSVICNEDYSRFDAAAWQAQSEDQGLLAGELAMRPRIDACELWPRRTIDESYFAPPVADRPVLILSGLQDPVTPAHHGERVAATLPDARHLLVPGVGHISSHYPCVRDLLAEFISNPDTAALDSSCLERLQARPFFSTSGGAP